MSTDAIRQDESNERRKESLETQPRFRLFVEQVTRLADAKGSGWVGEKAEEDWLTQVSETAKALVSVDDWLPIAAAEPHSDHYQQYLLYCDPQERFTVTSFVWGPGQRTPVHDHTTWGVIAMLRGAEYCQRFEPGTPMRLTAADLLREGETDVVSPASGDIHRVANGTDGEVAVSIHIYGGNIGRIVRHVFALETGRATDFISGYANVDANYRGYASFADRTI
ncbi:cysteine dioxygenase [Paraburkholderia guartelaensis]|uniref:cysteine dioxygenase family protein n=1 Tax=Paraburkholderia guartelaensis TaxID=2546446 RepID=UPI001FE6AD1A|nr:cysteine dioxygenase [Paraburkholderia guartelaensis]